ncbi:XrtA system polysaccharide deacetylase [Kordiimonas sp.]|uniref:XrtA system polysaccharide deacetylase n=1 Tax=Kordiimonas sp. TaxID=1970157 RepID=UPI003A8D75D5
MTNSSSDPLANAVPVSASTQFPDVYAFTVDVEEWFQVGAFENTIKRSDWRGLESRVEEQTYKVLGLLDHCGVKASFFCLGWVAERYPLLINAIHNAGHEVGCHGMDHERLFRFSRKEFTADVFKAKALLEDAIGVEVKGYRAPSFSLTPDVWWVYEVLEQAGFSYSSSLYPLKTDHYGMPDAPRRPFWPIGEGRILEAPMTVCKMLGRSLPGSGGGYFRLLPYALGHHLLSAGAKQNRAPGIFYMHPWEVDPDQPYRDDAPLLSRFRHYTGQAALPKKLERLCAAHEWMRLREAIVAPAYQSLEARG